MSIILAAVINFIRRALEENPELYISMTQRGLSFKLRGEVYSVLYIHTSNEISSSFTRSLIQHNRGRR